MAYTFEQLFAADPANPANIARNASILIFAPGDATMTPLSITDPSGAALPNPITVNANGFGSAFMHETLDRVAWAGGGFTAFMTSYEGMKAEAVAARTAAETAEAAATTAGADAAAEAATALAGAVADAEAAVTAAENAAALVGAPADSAIAAAINGSATATKTALNATYATKAEVGTPPAARHLSFGLATRETTLLRGVVLGDSITEGFNATPRTKRWTSRMEKMLQAAFNPNGINGGYFIRGKDASPVWTKTGTTGDEEPFGFGIRSLKMVAGSTATHSATVTTGFTVNFIPGATRGGSVTISIDNGPEITFRPKNSTTGEWKSGVLTRGAHSIRITAVETTVLTDVYVHDGDHDLGVQFYSAGIAGATASNYANDANTDHWARMTRMKDSIFMVPFMIGTNDYQAQIPIATFKAAVVATLAKVKTALGKDVWTPLIGQPRRHAASLPIPFDDYLTALQEVANENPNYVTFHNLDPFFAGSDAGDVYNLMDTDGVHPTTAGHQVMADLLATMWGIPARTISTATVPAVGTGASPADYLARDTFTKADGSSISTLDTGQTWVKGSHTWLIANNEVHGLGYATIALATTDFDQSLAIRFTSNAGVSGLLGHYIDDSNHIIAYFDQSANLLQLAKVDGGTITTLASGAAHTVTAGSTVTLRFTSVGGALKTYINGVQKHSVTLAGADLTKFGTQMKVGMRQNDFTAWLDNYTVA